MKLSRLIKQKNFASTEQEALLNVIVTGNWIMSELASAMADCDVTPAQYNVLRILRGSHPKRLTCSAIGERLLDRTPDVTRLLNRLEGMNLIDRRRADYDRRVVEVSITDSGLDLLTNLQPEIDAVQDRLMHHLSEEEQRKLTTLLEQLRTDQQ